MKSPNAATGINKEQTSKTSQTRFVNELFVDPVEEQVQSPLSASNPKLPPQQNSPLDEAQLRKSPEDVNQEEIKEGFTTLLNLHRSILWSRLMISLFATLKLPSPSLHPDLQIKISLLHLQKDHLTRS